MKKMNEPFKKDIWVLDYAFSRIGGKYKGRILWTLSKHPSLRYGELSRQMSDVSTKMLTQTLRELEADDLIHREMVHYSLIRKRRGSKASAFSQIEYFYINPS